MNQSSIEFISILVAVSGLLGWLLKQVITYFIESSKEKSSYIEKLVAGNQKNIEEFVNTINHQRTKDREMQGKINDSLQDLKCEISNTNKINEKVFNFLSTK